jgi:spectinomycin phosphotransferase
MEYVPEGGGSHHWKLTGDDGLRHFVTVDDLDDKDWLGDTREAVFKGLGFALDTAAALRHEVGLPFVVAPIAARDGELLRRLDDRYTVSVFPFLAGRSYPFGPYTDARLRGLALDMIAALHQSTPAVRGRAPHHVPRFAGRGDLDAFLRDPDRPWDGGPFSEPARRLLVTRTADLAQLAGGFDRLAGITAPARADRVITHGEPHPANLMSVDGRLVLIDWDTAALAPPERDVALIATTSNEGIDRYQQATGHELDPRRHHPLSAALVPRRPGQCDPPVSQPPSRHSRHPAVVARPGTRTGAASRMARPSGSTQGIVPAVAWAALAHTSLGTCPAYTRRMILCPKSAVGPNISGQPPSITVMPWARP